jgi:hypothetical protein
MGLFLWKIHLFGFYEQWNNGKIEPARTAR